MTPLHDRSANDAAGSTRTGTHAAAQSGAPIRSGAASTAAVHLPPDGDGRVTGRKALAYRFLARVAYWSPVFLVLVLFAQVSFLGLRPAMAEARRLADAEVMLNERHERALEQNAAVTAQIVAREDPIFRERQRRMRVIERSAEPETTRDAPQK